MTFRTIARTIATLAVAVAAVVAGPSAAHAASTEVQHGSIRIDPSIVRGQIAAMPMAMSGKGCTFYEHADGGGESWHKEVGWLSARYANQDSYAEYVTTVGDWWDNRISSMQCDESDQVHCSVGVYPDHKKGGREAIFWGSQGLINMADWGYDETISSYMIFCNLMK